MPRVELDVGHVAMSYLMTNIPCFACIACTRGAHFIQLRDAFAMSCNCASIHSNEPHRYGVTSFGLEPADTFVGVATAGALLHAVVRHEARSVLPQNAVVARTIRAALVQLQQGHGDDYRFSSFDVKCVLLSALRINTNGLYSTAVGWLDGIEAAGVTRRVVSARKIARAITSSCMFDRAMERGYAPGGSIADALMLSFASEFHALNSMAKRSANPIFHAGDGDTIG